MKKRKLSFDCFLKPVLWTALFSIGILPTFAQLPSSDFTLPSQACLQELLIVKNSSASAISQWDFCQGDLMSSNPIIITSTSIPALLPIGPTLIEVNQLWYGFVCDRSGKKIYRLDFGSSLLNKAPVVTDLGNIGGNLNSPQNIKIVEYQGFFFGFVNNLSYDQLVRINFGNNIESTAVTSDILSLDGGFGNGGLDVVYDGTNWVVALSNNNSISLFNLGSSPGNTVAGTMSTSVISGVADIGDIKFAIDNGTWYAFVIGYSSNTLHRLTFGSSVFSNPTAQLINISFGGLSPYGFEIEKDDGQWIIISTTGSGNIVRINFGTVITNVSPQLNDLGRFSVLLNTFKVSLAHSKSRWVGLTTRWDDKTFFLMEFPPSACFFNQTYSSRMDSVHIKPSSAATGDRTITQYTKNNDGILSSTTKTITISGNPSPKIDFTNTVCFGVPTSFNMVSDVALSSVSWDFNNDNVVDATTVNPSYTFGTLGVHYIYAEIENTSGCKNRIVKAINLYNQPTANFSLPTPSVSCTNQNYTFTNTSAFDAGSNPAWQWSVNGFPAATDQDLSQSFTSTNSQSIQLIATIPGCSSQTAKSFVVQEQGPLTNFSITGKCQNDVIQFTNQTTGPVTGYAWDFDNGNSSTSADTQSTYPATGVYNVKLVATNAIGCNNSTIKPITIYSKPQPNFSLDLPPFSCSGTTSQFNDLTPSPTDSNLSSWAWTFGEAGTSTDRNPLHTFTNAGAYNVSLTATTNFGCSASFQKSVTIAASPAANFTYTPACINQGTRFTDASGPGVKSWFWTIGSSTYAFNNPTHVFSSSGSYSAKLTVTGNNNCVATVSKTITVPVAPSLNFSVDNACEKQAANFKDTSPMNIDPAASWSWDFAGQGTATGNATQYSFAKAGSYAVRMTSTQQSGCVYSLSKNVTINTTPVAAFTSSLEWGVPPLSVQFTNTSTGASSYIWHFNDKNNSTSTLASPGFQFTDLGDYVVDLLATSALGCSSSASGKISVIIPSLDLELKQLQLVKDPTSNVYRIFVTVKNKSNYLLTSIDVVVDISGNALIKETITTNLLPGAEVVQLLNNQILPHGNLLTYLCASIEMDNDNDPFNNSKCEPVEEETIVFNPYPNPSNGTFRFEWIAPSTDNAHFEIFNAMGQLAFEQYAESVQVGLNQVQFDLSNLNTGAYYFRFSSNSTTRTLPIQIVR